MLPVRSDEEIPVALIKEKEKAPQRLSDSADVSGQVASHHHPAGQPFQVKDLFEFMPNPFKLLAIVIQQIDPSVAGGNRLFSRQWRSYPLFQFSGSHRGNRRIDRIKERIPRRSVGEVGKKLERFSGILVDVHELVGMNQGEGVDLFEGGTGGLLKI